MKTALTACLLCSAAAVALAPLPQRLALVPDDILIGFDESDIEKRWITVNDNVMGGRSSGGFSIADGRLSFKGSTNTNGGGFSSIRTRSADLNLDGTEGLLYRVRGDGRTYTAALRNGQRFGSFDISYWAEFETSGEWQTIRIPFEDFRPTFFGEDITGRAPELRPEEITGAAFYIYDKKDGPFSLDIEWIGSYTDDANDLALRAETEPQIAAAPESAGTIVSNTATSTSAANSAAAAKTWGSSVLAIAIERGVPQFNDGNPAACADIYEVAIASLVMSPSALPGDAVALLKSGLRAGRQAGSHGDRAWAYRYAMDAALGMLEVQPASDPHLSVRAE